MASPTGELVSYKGFEECVRLANDHVEVIAPTAIGPRILSFGLVDGPNELHQIEGDMGETGGDEYRFYGGHRLWYAPEVAERTTIPDNVPLAYDLEDGRAHLRQPVEPGTGIRKELVVEVAEDAPEVTVTHRLTNEGLWPVELAPWGITVLRGGGTAVMPVSREGGDARLPDRSLTLWPYTSLDDDRIEFDEGEVMVEHDAEGDGECKLGASGADEWTAYLNDGRAFVKTFDYEAGATYPDRGSAVEVYTNEDMLELETLAPLSELGRGETVEHVETWQVVEDAPDPDGDLSILVDR